MVEIVIGAGKANEAQPATLREFFARSSRRPVIGQPLEDCRVGLRAPVSLQQDAAAGIEGDDMAQAPGFAVSGYAERRRAAIGPTDQADPVGHGEILPAEPIDRREGVAGAAGRRQRAVAYVAKRLDAAWTEAVDQQHGMAGLNEAPRPIGLARADLARARIEPGAAMQADDGWKGAGPRRARQPTDEIRGVSRRQAHLVEGVSRARHEQEKGGYDP